MTTRLLPYEEWHRVAEAGVSPLMDPARNAVIAVEQDGAIVGCVVVMTTLHAEFLWIDPAHRGRVAVFRALWRRLVDEARAVGARTVLAAAMTRSMRRMLSGLGQVLPGDHYVMTLQEIDRCLQR